MCLFPRLLFTPPCLSYLNVYALFHAYLSLNLITLFSSILPRVRPEIITLLFRRVNGTLCSFFTPIFRPKDWFFCTYQSVTSSVLLSLSFLKIALALWHIVSKDKHSVTFLSFLPHLSFSLRFIKYPPPVWQYCIYRTKNPKKSKNLLKNLFFKKIIKCFWQVVLQFKNPFFSVSHPRTSRVYKLCCVQPRFQAGST